MYKNKTKIVLLFLLIVSPLMIFSDSWSENRARMKDYGKQSIEIKGSNAAEGDTIPWDVLDSGGGLMCSENYSVGGSLGQIAPGVCTTTTRIVSAGYWAGIDTLPPCVTGDEFIRADANADSSITMSDAIYTLKHLYVPGSDPPTCMKTADSDDNGDVAMSDAIYTLKYLYVPGAPPPPAPFPDCGVDPTSDELSCEEHPCMGGVHTGVKEAKPMQRMKSLQ